MVAAFGDVTAYYAVKNIRYKMLQDETGRRILREKPRIDSSVLNFQELQKLPTNTLGYIYSDYMIRNKISNDTREPVHYIDDVELAYVMQRYREIHDFNHVLSGIPGIT
uniref:Ubiquinone biosynthesis protein coq4, mitochondrial (Trinotate prediction) n=1 Tax=Myxobolus squamalis TaxID=59785 RepID=A0A6B2G0S1_MYXSQ